MYAGMLNEADELAEIERLRNKWKVGGSAKSAGVSYLSTLRTSVTAVTSLPNEEVIFTGSLIPDATYDTTYYVVATTVKNLTDEQVRELVMNPDYAEGVKTGVVLPADGTLSFTDEPLPNVIDTSTSAPYTIHSSKSVNTAHVYMYAKDAYTGVKVHEDIDYIELTTTEVGPRVYVPTVVFRPFENDVTVSGTTYSDNSSVATIYIGMFDPSVDLSGQTETQIKDYIVANSTSVPLVVNQKVIGSFTDVQASIVFTDLVGGTAPMEDNVNYDLRVVVVDALSAKGMGTFINESGFLSVRDVDWSTIQPGVETYSIPKTSPGGQLGRCCAISADGKTILVSGQLSYTTGCAYIYRYDELNNTWNEDRTNLNSSHIGADVYGNYGYSCDISADGNVALIAGYDGTTAGCGYVWRYNVDLDEWIVDSSNLNSTHIAPSVDVLYGFSCTISSDGKVAIIAGYKASTEGKAYVWRYDESTSTWSVDSSNLNSSRITANIGSNYGFSCSLSADGQIALVSSYTTTTSGIAYVWRYDKTTQLWNLDTNNLNSSVLTTSVIGRYGMGCCLSADGNIALITGDRTNRGTGHILRYNEQSDIWVEDDTNLNVSGISGAYGYFCSLSADGNTALISGYRSEVGGNAYVWKYNGTAWVNVANVSRTTTTYYGHGCALSGNGTTVVVSGHSTGSPYNTTSYVWKGQDNGELYKIPFYGTSSIQSASTLRTTIESATLADTLTFTGEVIPDSDNLTTYYAMATTKDLTNSEARTMIVNPAYSTAVVTAVDVSTLTTLTDTLLDNVVDASDTVVPSNTVNYTNVYLYATDGDLEHDDIDVKVIDGTIVSNVQSNILVSDENDLNDSLSISSGGEIGAFQTLQNGDIVHMTGPQQNSPLYSAGNLFKSVDGLYYSHISPGYIVYDMIEETNNINTIYLKNEDPRTKTVTIQYYDNTTYTYVNVNNQNPLSFNDIAAEEIFFTFTSVKTTKIRIMIERQAASGFFGIQRMKIFKESMYLTDNFNPHITISNVSDVQAGTPPTLTVDGSVFSSVADIASVKAMVFPSDADLTDETLVKAFIVANGTTVATTPTRNTVGQFSGIVMDKFYSSTDGYATGDAGADMVVGDKYVLRVISTDSLGNVGFNSYTTQATWWRIEYGISASSSTNYYSRILELGLRDDITTLPSSGNTISPILRTSNLKDIYVWTRLTASANTLEIPNLFEQYNVNNTFGPEVNGTTGDVIKTIFDGSTSTTQQHMYGYNVTEQTDPNGKVRFDYEFTNPTDALEIVFTDGNDSTNGYLGGITSMSIYKSNTGGKNDNEWELHSKFDNYNNPDVIADSNTSSEGWDNTFAPKGLKVIQYNETTKQWEFKGLFVVS